MHLPTTTATPATTTTATTATTTTPATPATTATTATTTLTTVATMAPMRPYGPQTLLDIRANWDHDVAQPQDMDLEAQGMRFHGLDPTLCAPSLLTAN